jgi:hypothetical protein
MDGRFQGCKWLNVPASLPPPLARHPLRLGDLSGRYQPPMFTSDASIVRAIHITETPI